MYVDDAQLVSVQHSADDMTTLTASTFPASDHVRRLVRGEDGVNPNLAPKPSPNWDTNNDAMGFSVNSHLLRIWYPREKTEAMKRLSLV